MRSSATLQRRRQADGTGRLDGAEKEGTLQQDTAGSNRREEARRYEPEFLELAVIRSKERLIAG